ncbi:Vacuolar calcium ion transporter [Coemansia helicoidea]|uniref:Vacuolar calcium ion transporter n=1 Tax=Coemansia helicoidea TaxID=1286919 RepID=A0ACC1L8S4_9FUNG|nr:Vacuolar calcium ion transporter [Coemansia helicoidea]
MEHVALDLHHPGAGAGAESEAASAAASTWHGGVGRHNSVQQSRRHRVALHRLTSFSHDGAMGYTAPGMLPELPHAARPTTAYGMQPFMRRESTDSPDLLNSRQLRRRVARCVEPSDADPSSPEARQSSERKGEHHSRDTATGGGEAGGPSIVESLQNAVCGSWFNVLLVFAPLGYVAHYLAWPVIAVFVLNYLAIIPLSALLGFAIEEVTLRLGPTWGGVVNAVFGNTVELIIAVIALTEEEYRIVQAGLIGSVLSNTLLLLGCAFLAGGLYHRVQLFHAEAAQCAGSLLALSVLSMIIPAAYHGVHASGGEITNGILVMSRGTALILLVVYILFLIFQLKTHSDIFDGSHTHSEHASTASYKDDRGSVIRGLEPSRTLTGCYAMDIASGAADLSSDDGTAAAAKPKKHRPHHLHHSGPMMKLWVAAALLLLVAAMVAMSSDILVESVEELTTRYAISHTFVGMILLPIASNAGEHAVSVTVAVRDKMDVCITVAVGSSMQIALFVLPVLIIIAWVMDSPLTLFFDDFETTTMLICVLVINYLIMNGRSNWLKGAMLLSSYFIVALAFLLYPYDVDDPRATALAPSSMLHH